ncbi:hypothetical protein ScPMuIL_018748 [Solemya velum]
MEGESEGEKLREGDGEYRIRSKYSKHETGCEESRTQYSRWTWLLVLSNLLLAATALTLVAVWRTAPIFVSSDPMSLQQSICLACEDIGENDDEDKIETIRRHRTDSGGWMCCAEAHDLLGRLINESVKGRYRTEKILQDYANQLRGWWGISETNGVDGDRTLQWDQSSGQSFSHSNITYHNGRLTVLTSGYYYVYTQVLLKNSDVSALSAENDSVTNTTTPLYHVVYKKNAKSSSNAEEKLLENVQTHYNVPFSFEQPTGRVGSGRVGSGVGSGRVGSGRVGSGRVGSAHIYLRRPYRFCCAKVLPDLLARTISEHNWLFLEIPIDHMVCDIARLFDEIIPALVIVLMWTLRHRQIEGNDGSCTLCLSTASTTICCLREYIDKNSKKTAAEFMGQSTAEDRRLRLANSNLVDEKYYPWEVNPSAMLEGDRSYKESNKESPLQTVRGWRVGLHTYLRNGMELINGRIFVPQTGTYGVYSYILFGDTNPKPFYQNMEQRVFRYNVRDRREEELLSNSRPYTEPRNPNLRIFTSYMASDVKLLAGDFIYVKVSNVTSLQFPDCNYLGVYML